MANRKRGGGGAAGGIKGFLASGLMIVLIAAAVVGWWNFNGFKNVGDAIDWFQTKSLNMDNCVDGELSQDRPDAQNIVGAHGCIIPKVTGINSNPSFPGGEVSKDGVENTITILDSIEIAPAQDVKYSRSEWKHWLDLDGNGCDTREQVLMETGTDVNTDPKTCKVLSGSWVEPYSGTTVTDSSAMDLDHVVPLSYAAQHGGNAWSTDRKTEFANDPMNLYLSNPSENRSKGDKGLAEYLPPNKDFQCVYVNVFVTVAHKYELSITQMDKSAAEKVIKERC